MKRITTIIILAFTSLSVSAQLFDTTGIGTWPVLSNSYETWLQGAFDANRDTANPGDFGWGEYDIATHFIEGDSIYILKTIDNEYKAISIDRLASGTYTISYSNLDGSAKETQTLNRTPYNTKNFFYFSMNTETVKDLEPASYNWDIVFTKFLTFFPGFGGYPVAGVLHNKDVQVSQVEKAVGQNANLNDTINFPFQHEINTIGYDWKDAFAGIVYDSITYYVKDQSGNINALQFSKYGGSATGKMVFTVNGIKDSVILGQGNNDQVYYSLQLGQQVLKNQDHDWDLAFYAQSSFSAIPVRVNEVGGAELYLYPKSDISRWASVGLNETAFDVLSLFPNPAQSTVFLQLSEESNQPIQISLLNTNGQIVKTFSKEWNSSMDRLPLSLEGVTSGAYIVLVKSQNSSYSSRLIVQP